MIWCKEALQGLANNKNNAFAQDFPLPPTLSSDSLLPCPTVRLTTRFLEHLASSMKVQNQGETEQSVTPNSADVARDVLDAFIFSVHGLPIAPDSDNSNNFTGCFQYSVTTTAHSDFGAIVSYFPYVLRLLIQVCIQQAQQQPNPLWPAYLLKLVDRKDLCGKLHFSCLFLAFANLKTFFLTLFNSFHCICVLPFVTQATM